MSAQWDTKFNTWAQPPSATEQEKIENSVTGIKKAIAASTALAGSTKVFVQGSYRNRVNVRQDSDVDVGVLYTGNLFGTNYPEGKTDSDFNVSVATYGYPEFKRDLHSALVAYFPTGTVTRGNKAFDIDSNTYRVDADVVPLMVHRRYSVNGSYICGTQLNPDSGGLIINWPERLYDTAEWPPQHYENGNSKNNETRRAYRSVVRIIKKLRNVMDEDGIVAAKPLPGFFVECLVWNAPNSCFANSTYFEDVRSVLNYLSFQTASAATCNEWGEVSEFKYLFKGNEAKRLQAKRFVDAARTYIGIA